MLSALILILFWPIRYCLFDLAMKMLGCIPFFKCLDRLLKSSIHDAKRIGFYLSIRYCSLQLPKKLFNLDIKIGPQCVLVWDFSQIEVDG